MSQWDSELQDPSPHAEPLNPERIDTTELFETTEPEALREGDWRTNWSGSPEQAEQAAMIEQYNAEQQGAAATESSTSDSTSDSTSETYDPSAANVDDVIAYVDAHPDQLDEVYNAELADKARSTLLDRLDAMREV